LSTIAVKWTVCTEPEVCTYRLDGTTLTVTAGGKTGVVIVTVALADLLVSVNDVAVIVTVLPGGTTDGDVYMESPVADVAGLKDPQELDPQVAEKATPAFNGSLVTCVTNCSGVFTKSVAGTTEVNATPMGAGTMVKVTLLLCEGLLVTVPVIVTDALMGTTEGAVYAVACPSAVCTGDKVPQAPLVMLPLTGLPPQATTQSTPALMRSPVGIMLNFTVEAMASTVTLADEPLALVKVIGVAVACVLGLLLLQPITRSTVVVMLKRDNKPAALLRHAERARGIARACRIVFDDGVGARFGGVNRKSLILFCLQACLIRSCRMLRVWQETGNLKCPPYRQKSLRHCVGVQCWFVSVRRQVPDFSLLRLSAKACPKAWLEGMAPRVLPGVLRDLLPAEIPLDEPTWFAPRGEPFAGVHDGCRAGLLK
jgi:hypothetical protein